MSYYPKLDSHIRDKNNQNMLQALINLTQLLKKFLLPFPGEVDKIDINKLTNVPKSVNDLKTKVNNVDGGKLKNIPNCSYQIRKLLKKQN